MTALFWFLAGLIMFFVVLIGFACLMGCYHFIKNLAKQYGHPVEMSISKKCLVFIMAPFITIPFFFYCLVRLILADVIKVDYYGKT